MNRKNAGIGCHAIVDTTGLHGRLIEHKKTKESSHDVSVDENFPTKSSTNES